MSHLPVGKGPSVPLDDEGNPMALISFGVEEKIGLPNYSNVTYDASSMRFVKDTDTERKAGWTKTIDDVESIAREQREVILAIAKKQVQR